MSPETLSCPLSGSRDDVKLVKEQNCTSPLGTKCQACAEADEVDKEIAAADPAHLQSLNQRRRNIQSAQNEAHDPFILRLPVELASAVFELSLESCTFEELFWSSRDLRRPRWYEGTHAFHPNKIASVCRGWRDIALGTARLWTKIYVWLDIACGGDLPGYLSYLSTLLRRSKTLPLSIHLYGGFIYVVETKVYMPLIDLLNEESVRWGELLIDVPTELFPLLKGCGLSSNHLTGINMFHLRDHERDKLFPDQDLFRLAGGAPSPTHIKSCGALFKSVHVDWTRATHIKFEGLYSQDFFFILSAAPELHFFEAALFPIDKVPEGGMKHGGVIVHNQLAILIVSQGYRQLRHPEVGFLHASNLFTKMVFPKLRYLKLHGFNTITGIADFVSRSSCPLRKLFLWYCVDTSASVLAELQRLPMLHTLRISRPGMNIRNLLYRLAKTRMFDEDQPTEHLFLPNLKTFLCHARMDEWQTSDWKYLADIFAPPSSPSFEHPGSGKKPRPLQDVDFGVKMDFSFRPMSYIPQSELRRLEEVMDSGVEVYIQGRDYPDDRRCFTEISQIYYDTAAIIIEP